MDEYKTLGLLYKFGGCKIFKVRKGSDFFCKRLRRHSSEETARNYISRISTDEESSLCPSAIKIIDSGTFLKERSERWYTYTIMELCTEGTNLSKEIERRIETSEHYIDTEFLQIIFDFISTLAYFQSINFCHRDIKPDNILFSMTGQLKLGDFEDAKFVKSEPLHTFKGTLTYLSPKLRECFAEDDLNSLVDHNPFKSDVYSLGLVFLSMCTLEIIKPEFYNLSMIESSVDALLSKTTNAYIRLILKKMLKVDEDERYDFLQLKVLIDKIWTGFTCIICCEYCDDTINCNACCAFYHKSCIETQSKNSGVKLNTCYNCTAVIDEMPSGFICRLCSELCEDNNLKCSGCCAVYHTACIKNHSKQSGNNLNTCCNCTAVIDGMQGGYICCMCSQLCEDNNLKCSACCVVFHAACLENHSKKSGNNLNTCFNCKGVMEEIKSGYICCICSQICEDNQKKCNSCSAIFHAACLRNQVESPRGNLNSCINCNGLLRKCEKCDQPIYNPFCKHELCKKCAMENSSCSMCFGFKFYDMNNNSIMQTKNENLACLKCGHKYLSFECERNVLSCLRCESIFCRVCKKEHHIPTSCLASDDEDFILIKCYICGLICHKMRSELFYSCLECNSVCIVCTQKSDKVSHLNCSALFQAEGTLRNPSEHEAYAKVGININNTLWRVGMVNNKYATCKISLVQSIYYKIEENDIILVEFKNQREYDVEFIMKFYGHEVVEISRFFNLL